MKVSLVCIDPQNDFCIAQDAVGNRGTLVVPGADKDMDRLAAFIRRVGHRLTGIHVTLDSHQTIGIERPQFWARSTDLTAPNPFTVLGVHPDGRRVVRYDGSTPTEDEYVTRIPSLLTKGGPTGRGALGYLEALAAGGRQAHVIWPEHCIVGTWGHAIVPSVSLALCDWERANLRRVNYVAKGNNPLTEHFSAVRAEVVDPNDPSTQINTNLIRALMQSDEVAITGEALSHCVANSVRDVADNFGDPAYISKLVLLRDTCSSVPGFEAAGDAFIRDLTARGMRISDSLNYLT